jgi:hypothetical protein
MKQQVKKVIIEGNGSQAPYGIGEIIDIMPASHYKKIHKFCRQWYNGPTLRDNDTGEELQFAIENEEVVGIEKWKN